MGQLFFQCAIRKRISKIRLISFFFSRKFEELLSKKLCLRNSRQWIYLFKLILTPYYSIYIYIYKKINNCYFFTYTHFIFRILPFTEIKRSTQRILLPRKKLFLLRPKEAISLTLPLSPPRNKTEVNLVRDEEKYYPGISSN